MKIKSFKCTCGHDDFFFANKGNQTGIFCSECGKWLKWADKDEKNLQLKGPNIAEVLNKISAEIEERIAVYDNWQTQRECTATEANTMREVLAIVKKYMAESEGTE